DFVDQPELVDIGGNLRIIDGLERGDDVVGEPRQLAFRQRRGRRGAGAGRGRSGGRWACCLPRKFVRLVSGANRPCAMTRACASPSASARVLERPNEARQVAVTPKRASSGITQWVPARTATPARSMMVATSWGCAPLSSKETMGPLSLVVPKMRSEL